MRTATSIFVVLSVRLSDLDTIRFSEAKKFAELQLLYPAEKRQNDIVDILLSSESHQGRNLSWTPTLILNSSQYNFCVVTQRFAPDGYQHVGEIDVLQLDFRRESCWIHFPYVTSDCGHCDLPPNMYHNLINTKFQHKIIFIYSIPRHVSLLK